MSNIQQASGSRFGVYIKAETSLECRGHQVHTICCFFRFFVRQYIQRPPFNIGPSPCPSIHHLGIHNQAEDADDDDASLTTPCTTACSPNIITLPGAETVTSSSNCLPFPSCASPSVAPRPRVLLTPLTNLSIALPPSSGRLTHRARSSIHLAGFSLYSAATASCDRGVWARLC